MGGGRYMLTNEDNLLKTQKKNRGHNKTWMVHILLQDDGNDIKMLFKACSLLGVVRLCPQLDSAKLH